MDLITLVADLGDSWLDGTLRTLGTVQCELGAFPQDPPPVTPYTVIYEGGKLRRACVTIGLWVELVRHR
jgi:hypothetical protein